MANFNEHISHAKNNLDFLSNANSFSNANWDWQVTITFYTAVHLMNAHVVAVTGKNYLTHTQTSQVISPYGLSPAKVNEEVYLAYTKLLQLSRRSRYLLNENFSKKAATEIQPCCLTYDRHFKKSIGQLEVILDFIEKDYKIRFQNRELRCLDMKNIYKYFTINN